MLETAYFLAKLFVSVMFILLAVLLIVLCTKAKTLKLEFMALEKKIKHDINTQYNIGTAVITLLLTVLFSSPSTKLPFWVSILSYLGLSKYKTLYSPISALWRSSKDLGDRIKDLIK